MQCSRCDGTGKIYHSRLHPTNPVMDWWEDSICPLCRGTGGAVKYDCEDDNCEDLYCWEHVLQYGESE